MISFPGYHVLEKLHESHNSYVFRAFHEETHRPVVIKVLKGEYPNPERIVLFRRDFEILKGLKPDCAIKVLSFENFNNCCAIIMEDIGAESINNILKKRKLTLNEFLDLALRITEILEQLHDLNIIHKNINPSNLIWNQSTGKLKIIDFSISTVLPHEIAAIQNPSEFEGTLSYISPEQTGRMNRMVDYRTDMYSLGVTLYEMLTGQLPFPAIDPMDIVYCHLAKNPVPPNKLIAASSLRESGVHEILSKIILKLMSKSAEDRYLSYFGLTSDLKKCFNYLKKPRIYSDPAFTPGEIDFSARFQIPQKLYGRENEIAFLLKAFDRVSDRLYGGLSGEIMLVKGYAGVGKSALVNEIRVHVAEKRGFFINGTFDRFRHNIPYLALTQAFHDLVKQILMESESEIKLWKARILEAVGPNGQIIIDVIPEVEMITGRQPQVPELPPHETQNRFNFYFMNFIRIFADENHPLAIFLDNLQWADIPTLKFLERLILDSGTRYMLIIGAFRDNEINQNHPLNITLSKLKDSNALVNYITLNSLELHQINQLISESLKCDIAEADNLGRLCLAKTNGNPFFLIQFLNSLVDLRLIEFDTKSLKWIWHDSKIEKTDITGNVIGLMTSRVRKLSERTKRILKLASCIGSVFDLDTLSIIYNRSAGTTANDLNEALERGIIKPIGEDYRLAGYLNILKDNTSIDRLKYRIRYKFLHDRVHQTVYSLIGDEVKSIHLKIGKLLMQKFSEEAREERIFYIVNHLNQGTGLISNQAERDELAGLNLLAGRKAKAATAYEIAFQYFNRGYELLGEKSWTNQYSLTLELTIELAEASYLTGNFEKMDELALKVSVNAKTLLDRIRINEIVIQSLIARTRIKEGYLTAIEILRQLGVHIPTEPTRLGVMVNLLLLRRLMSGKKLEDLKNLPVMTDPQKLAAMRILMNSASSAYYSNILIAITIALKMVNLSVRYGNSPFSAFGYALYSIILQGIFGEITAGYQLGEFAIELLKIFNSKEYESRILFTFNLFIKHRKDKLIDAVEPFSETYQRGIETGDYEFASYAAAYTGINLFHSGVRLEIAEAEMSKNVEVVRKLNQLITLNVLGINLQAARNLMGKSKNKSFMCGDSYDETIMIPILTKNENIADYGTLIAIKTFLSFMFDEREQSLGLAMKAEKFKQQMMGIIYEQLICFYTSLIYLSHFQAASPHKRISLLFRVFLNQKKTKKWARYAPENLLHRWHLVEAERYRILGSNLKAMKHYDRAVILARKNGYMHEEALANELAAKYYLSIGFYKNAKTYIKEASYLYSSWGAVAKTEQLNLAYPDILNSLWEEPDKENANGSFLLKSTGIHQENLDLATVQKASQTISGEIHLDKLLEKLMRIVVTNAGAQNGFLLLKDDKGLFVEAEAVAGKDEIMVLQHISCDDKMNASLAIINYVLRTNKMIVLNDAANQGNFKSDEYITTNNVKSVLCLPLLFQNKLNGILYLENNLATSTFTAERVKVLRILAGQIVISIENARLYSSLEDYNRTLEENVAKRTVEISQKNEQLNRRTDELNVTLDNLKQSQYQLIQAEKMASLGQLVAGIAHEINNPVNFISAGVDSLSTNLKEVNQMLEIYHRITPENVEEKLRELEALKGKIEYSQILTEINELIESIKTGTDRTTEIIKGLRIFSRLDEDIVKMADVHESLNSTLTLLQNKYRDRIEIERNYADIPRIECYPGQLNQVFMNIFSNAIDSIEDKGRITIKTSISDESVQIRIKDTGRGIPKNYQARIFEPFFTTKEVGQGTGLGLSISHGIIEKHMGTIEVQSELGHGSEFIISLPLKQSHK